MRTVRNRRAARAADPPVPAVAGDPVPPPEAQRPFPSSRVFWTLVGVVLIAWGLFHLRSYCVIVPPVTFDKSPGEMFRIWSLLGPGILLAAWGYSRVPNRPSGTDTGPLVSRIVLFLILVLTVVMRVYHFDQVEGKYWQDFALPLGDAGLLVNLRQWFAIGPFQPGEAFYPVLIAGILEAFPKMSGYIAQRVASLLIDVAAVWVYYLLGKEFGRRRIGLLMAAVGSFTRPMMGLYLCYMRMPAVALTVAMIMLFTMRIVKKPTWAHFLQWGLSVALGYHTYTAYRPMGPYFVLALLAWVLFRRKERPLGASGWVLGFGLLALLGVLFTYEHRFIFKPESILWMVLSFLVEKARFAIVASAGLVLALAWHLRRVREGKRDPVVLYWFLAAVLVLLLVIPVFQVVSFSQRLTPASFMTQQVVEDTLPARFFRSVQTLFYAGIDRDDMNLYGDSFFDIPTGVLIILGAVFTLTRPTWPRLFVLLAALFGMIPHVLADPGGSRLSSCIAPFLLLGALGTDRLFEAASRTCKPAFWRGTLAFLFTGLVLSGSWIVFQKCHFHFMTKWNAPVVLARQAYLDEKDHRVYSGMYSDVLACQVLMDGHRVHMLMPSTNPIPLGPGERTPDVVLLFDARFPPSSDTFDRIRRDFPGAAWERRPLYPWIPGCDIDFIRVRIPASQIGEDASKYIHVQRVPECPWLLRYYGSEYFMGRGMILQEEHVPELRASLPISIRARGAHLYDLITTGHETDLDLPKDGLYLFRMKAPMPAELWLDGERLVSLRPRSDPLQQIGGVQLKSGKHRLVLRCFPRVDMDVPFVWIRHPGTVEWKTLVTGRPSR